MDVTTFVTLYEQHHRAIQKRLARIVGDELAEDACQETWIRVWKHGHSFRGTAKPSTWLYRVATNAALDVLRRERRQTRGEEPIIAIQSDADTDGRFSGPLTSDSTWQDPHPDPERAYAASERMERVEAGIERLPALTQEIVWAVAMGAERREIGAEIGMHEGTVKSRVNRARAFLQTV